MGSNKKVVNPGRVSALAAVKSILTFATWQPGMFLTSLLG